MTNARGLPIRRGGGGVLLLCALVQGPRLHGQARCVDPLADASWRSTPLTATIETPAPGERAVDRYLGGFAPLLGQSFVDPSSGSIRPGAMVTVPAVEARAEIRGTMVLTLDRNGRVLAALMTTGTGIARLDSALVHGARAAGGDRGFGKAPRQFRGDTLQVTLRISDRAPPSPRTAALGSYSTSYLVADVPPRIRSMPPARAPRGRRGREVTLAATVSAEGRVVPGTIRVVSTNDSSLIAVARSSLERSVYRPGTKNGCPAESNIRQRFPF